LGLLLQKVNFLQKTVMEQKWTAAARLVHRTLYKQMNVDIVGV